MWWVVSVSCGIKPYMRLIVAIVAASWSDCFSMSCMRSSWKLHVL
jgi:hypothetical protein